jgi:hypothetical protein
MSVFVSFMLCGLPFSTTAFKNARIQQIGVDGLGVRRAHAVGELLVDLQLASLEQL